MWKYSLLIVLSAIGAYSAESITPFVNGGIAAVDGQFPSDCSIDSPFHTHCMGVVVNDRHILTSASCVMNSTVVGTTRTNTLGHPAWFRVMCGNNNLFVSSPGRYFGGVSHIYPHNAFNPTTNNNDLAILRLVDAIPLPGNTIEPAVFHPRLVPDSTQCSFSGWGLDTAQAVVVIAQKQVIPAPIVNFQTCNAAPMANPRALPGMICAGQTTGAITGTTCRGNEGGALYCDNQVVGILAFGTGCGAANTPGVYIQTRLHSDWMNTQIVRTDTIAAGTVYPRPA